MTDAARVPRRWEDLSVGLRAETPIKIRAEDMATFAVLSGDRSPVHVDATFARAGGFDAPIVYGALLVAALSRLVGMMLPGPIGVATGWRIDFHAPLYVDESAVLAAEISNVSDSTRTVKLRFTITCGDRLIAKGSAEAKIVA